MQRRIITLLLGILLLCAPTTQAQEALTNQAKISILTSAPWAEEIYALFGHTALRVKDPEQNLDIVFNYGLFDFSQPNFLYHFVKGETDYQLGGIYYSDYLKENYDRGLATTEQVIALDSLQRQQLWSNLMVNYQPENRRYRYNFFYDNCATRPLYMIESTIGDSLNFAPIDTLYTFRELVHQCTASYQWVTFGIDLVLGRDADQHATPREHLFLPHYMMKGLASATTTNGKAAVSQTNELILTHTSKENENEPSRLSAPTIFALIVLLLSITFTYNAKLQRWYHPAETAIFILAGLCGCLITFLAFFSVHPAVSNNAHLLWLNPLQLLIPLSGTIKAMRRSTYYLHFCNFVAITVFITLHGWYGQVVPTASILLAAALWSWSFYYIYVKRKKS